MGEAPAKVNLSLRVLARGPSGFHRIETVFQALRLSDALEIEFLPEDGVRLEVRGVPEGALGPPSQNLALRAAERFRGALAEKGGEAPGVLLRLEKRIPHGAGLGGGSSDAAAVLRGLNELSGRSFSHAELMRLGGDLGSDVPFFVSGAARARGLGRGERILPLPPLPRRHVLILVPSSPIATAWAYAVLAAGREAAGPELPRPPARAGRGGGWDQVEATAENDFEEALFPLLPDLVRLKESLTREGARPALLSGSGSSVFGLFRDPETLRRAATALEAAEPGVRVLRTATR